MSEEDKVKHPDQAESPEMEPADVAAQEKAAPQEGAAESLEPLRSQLEQAQAKVEEQREQLLRLQAELENQRRRAEREIENAHKYGVERFAQELLPVKDSLELGLAAATAEGQAVEKLREGTELTLKMLAGAMEKFGIQEVNPTGQPFDPQLHQAMSMQESHDQEPNTVLAVMQKGYLLQDRLIRPAMVIVARAPSDGPTIDEQA